MVYLSEDRVQELLHPAELISVIERAFRGGLQSPARTHHQLPGANAPTLLLMPAWRSPETIGVKIITVDTERRHTPAVEGVYLLLDGKTGAPAAILGARTLTAARTAAVSAVAASYLARPQAATLLMVGTGNLAAYLIEAHRCVRPITRVMIWGRSADKAEALMQRLGTSIREIEVEVVTNLRSAVAEADIISCATSSTAALIPGKDLSPGTHIDLVGSFKPSMREADNTVFERGRLVVDTHAAFAESGDLIDPVLAGIVDAALVPDLSALIQNQTLHRKNETEITLFKAVGTAISDLAAAEYLFEKHRLDDSAPRHERTAS